MTLFNKAQRKQLLKNGNAATRGKDHKPVAKLILPCTPLVFLITETDNEQPHLAFGLCDLGTGHPKLGYVDLNEMAELRTGDGYTVECDPGFEATHLLSVYTRAATLFRAITTDESELQPQITFLL